MITILTHGKKENKKKNCCCKFQFHLAINHDIYQISFSPFLNFVNRLHEFLVKLKM